MLRKAARSYSGELLADLALRDEAFGEWLAAERSRLKSAAIKLYDKLVEREYGDYRIDAAQQLLAIDCLREASHRSLMYAYAAQGDKALALKQFEQCRAIFREQLGVEPSARNSGTEKANYGGRMSTFQCSDYEAGANNVPDGCQASLDRCHAVRRYRC